jgi:hypothetical protein
MNPKDRRRWPPRRSWPIAAVLVTILIMATFVALLAIIK